MPGAATERADGPSAWEDRRGALGVLVVLEYVHGGGLVFVGFYV